MSKTKSLAGAALVGLVLVTVPTGVFAADLTQPVAPAKAESPFDVAFSITTTSDYIGRGISQTNRNPALQGTLEVDYDKFYASLFASNVDPAILSGAHLETDWAFGIRPVVGPLSLDLGYVWYIYDKSAANGSEAYIKASVNPVDPLTIGGSLFVSPLTSAVYSEANAAYKLPNNFSLSAAVGAVSNTAVPYTTWNAGISWKPIDPVTLDVRYYSSNLSSADCTTLTTSGAVCDTRIVGTLSFASTAKTLGLFN
ncbi:MAG: hypothetical protein JWN11_1135 [Hyphomicrobiales bacterium]|nr:hypothetical protein [Hyphomicrobiales bacterium]